MRNPEEEAARTRLEAKAGQMLNLLVQYNVGGLRLTEVRIATEGGTRAFVVLKGVKDGAPIIGFRSIDEILSGMHDTWLAVNEGKIKWKNDEWPNKLQKLLAGD